MTRINKIQPEERRKTPILTPKRTGYVAASAILLSSTRVFSSSKTTRKMHKFWGYLGAVLTLLHIGNVEYLHYKYKKM